MVDDQLLRHIPSVARYRRRPLEDRQNALCCWDEAAERMVALDDEALCAELEGDNSDADRLAALPGRMDADRRQQFLDDNRPTLALLHAGVRCARIQFPEPDEESGSVAQHAASISPLGQLAHIWRIHARALIADGNLSAASSELIAIGRMGQIICCGEAFVMHYFVGSAIMRMALADIERLATEHALPAAVVADLLAAVDRWLASAGDVAVCLRVDLNCFAVREIDRLAQRDELEPLVGQLLERLYEDTPLLGSEDQPTDGTARDHQLHDWRRDRILYLLDGHPAPFDRLATVGLVGRLVADRILDLQWQRRLRPLAPLARFQRAYRRSRFRARSRLWPSQLRPLFPTRYLGFSVAARQRLAGLRAHVSADQWAEIQPPTRARLAAVRRRLRGAPNILGVLVADALLATDIAGPERLRRRRLREVQAVLAAARQGARR